MTFEYVEFRRRVSSLKEQHVMLNDWSILQDERLAACEAISKASSMILWFSVKSLGFP